MSAAGIWLGSLTLLALGTLLVGCYQGFAQFYRFAAAEAADDRFRSRAISLVLAGGIVAAVAGPWLGRLGGPLLAVHYAGSFVLLTLVSLGAATVLMLLRTPNTARLVTEPHQQPRTWQQLVLQPAYAVALLAASTGYGVMILAMTATPIAMLQHQHDLSAASTVIQLHVLGMFVPSFFTGALIARYGVLPVMFAGVLLLCGHVLATLSGVGFGSFAAALVLLGVGWNFLYVGGTALLTTAHTAAEKGRAQALNDMTVFAVGLAASLGAGALLEAIGWQMTNLLLLPWLATAAAGLLWHGYRGRSKAPAPAR